MGQKLTPEQQDFMNSQSRLTTDPYGKPLTQEQQINMNSNNWVDWYTNSGMTSAQQLEEARGRDAAVQNASDDYAQANLLSGGPNGRTMTSVFNPDGRENSKSPWQMTRDEYNRVINMPGVQKSGQNFAPYDQRLAERRQSLSEIYSKLSQGARTGFDSKYMLDPTGTQFINRPKPGPDAKWGNPNWMGGDNMPTSPQQGLSQYYGYGQQPSQPQLPQQPQRPNYYRQMGYPQRQQYPSGQSPQGTQYGQRPSMGRPVWR